MASDEGKKQPGKPAPKSREDRLKAALKANMARRKAQTKARARVQTQSEDGQSNE